MSVATAERREVRREGYVPGSFPEIAPEHERLAAEVRAMALHEERVAVASEREAAKRTDAQAVLEQVYNFAGADGSTVALSGVEATERAYADYRTALETLVHAHESLVHIAPGVRAAVRTLGEGVAPEPLSVRTSLDHELRNLRARASAALAGDI